MTGKLALPQLSKTQAIVGEVRRRIVEREWRQGDRIPDEAELAVEFGVVRTTVNKALQLLAQEGLLDRKRRAGTHVAINPVRKASLSIPIVREQIESAGMAYSHRLVEQRRCPLPEEIAHYLRLPAGETLIHQQTVHYGDGRPFQSEDRWINPHAVPDVEAIDFGKINTNEWLVRHAPYLNAELLLSAESADRRDAQLLETHVGAALMIIRRTTWNDVGAITTVRLACHPGYSMSAAL